MYAIEALTNTHLREQVGNLAVVPVEQRASGPGASWIMAPFTHLSAPGGRFNTELFGAYYAARDLETAIAETAYHRERFLRATREPPMDIPMRELRAKIRAKVHDLRGLEGEHPELLDPFDYSASQALATRLRADGSAGVAWNSVRRAGGECVAVFIPKLVRDCKQAAHIAFVWDGTRITHYFEMTGLRAL